MSDDMTPEVALRILVDAYPSLRWGVEKTLSSRWPTSYTIYAYLPGHAQNFSIYVGSTRDLPAAVEEAKRQAVEATYDPYADKAA